MLVSFHCFCLHSMAIFHANKKLNLTIICNESGSNDASAWACEPTQLRRKELKKIFHAMSWNIHFPYGKFYVMWQNIPWQVMEYLAMSCEWFFGINNSLLTLNMGLANKAIECNVMWGFEDQKKGCISSSLVQTIFQMSRALGQKL